jgi:large subunit ribosomal protein L11
MQEIGLKKGSTAPGKDVAGKITKAQIESVAKKKAADMNSHDIEGCKQMVAGTAISMGLQIVE